MKRIYIAIIFCLGCAIALHAQDPVMTAQLGVNVQIVESDSTIVISRFGSWYGGTHEELGVIVDFELFPFPFFTDGTTGTRDLAPIRGLTVYPNPASEIVILSRDESEETYEVRIWSLDGNILATTPWRQDEVTMQFSLSPYPAGTYLLMITDNNRKSASHFRIVKH